jgi:hypothetical protein
MPSKPHKKAALSETLKAAFYTSAFYGMKMMIDTQIYTLKIP